jgi:hypothetical protein
MNFPYISINLYDFLKNNYKLELKKKIKLKIKI